MSAAPAKKKQSGGQMTIWQHLAELRSRLIKSFIAIGLGAVVGWILYPPVLDLALGPYQQVRPEGQVYVTDPLQLFTVRLQVSIYIGIAIAMPVILWQLWRFITPGLYPHEKRYAIPFVVVALMLFGGGASLAWYALTPALEFLVGLGGEQVGEIFSQESYLTFVLYMMLAFGVAFEVPVLLVALQLVGILTPRRLLGWWRVAIVLMAIAAAVITPSGDPLTMGMLLVPMVLLYFGSIGVGATVLFRANRKARKREAQASAAGSGDRASAAGSGDRASAAGSGDTASPEDP